jgi:TPR repeat protein
MNSIERHIRWLVDSDFALVRPKDGSGAGKGGAVLGVAAPQKLAVDEANQVLTFLDRQGGGPSPAAGGGTAAGSACPSPPRTPPDDAALAKAYPHHIRYMAAACRAPPSKALFYLEQARDAGSRLAGGEAGQMYVLGVGAARNPAKGLALLDEACSVGHPGAMFSVGRCLRDGVGVRRDLNAALVWLERAANLRYVPAAHELAEMFESGDFSPTDGSASPSATSHASLDPAEAAGAGDAPERDLVQALRLYKIAADLDYAPSQLNIAKLFLLGASLGVNEAPSEAELKARYWLEKAAVNGSFEAKALLQRARHDDPEDGVDRPSSKKSQQMKES